ncbi:MAG: hypothetical protein IJV55_02810 [Paludibacteraceae bacterium]|nr:hypothetical protein [Paludibacteraceae bacterium]MBQ9705110.1 hypothetical protein [Paludibacteraceae bacterium]
MKKVYILAIAALLAAMPAAAQQKGQNLALKVLVEDMTEPFPTTAKAHMENKLNMLLTQNGIASSDILSQFFITAKATPLTKDILPGAPTRIAESMEISFYIADYYSQIIYATTSVTAKGIGNTDAKAYMEAIRHINLNSPELKEFVATGKAKVIDYYNTQAPKMLAKANSLANQKKYEEALWLCACIPSECDHYQSALDAGDKIYQQYVDYLCQVNLAAAKMAWASGQNAMAATEAGEYLAQIYPDAKCYGEAEALYKEIKAKVLDDWKFEMKKYQDGVDLEMQRINSWRDVGVAYGEGQQPTSTNIGFIR